MYFCIQIDCGFSREQTRISKVVLKPVFDYVDIIYMNTTHSTHFKNIGLGLEQLDSLFKCSMDFTI